MVNKYYLKDIMNFSMEAKMKNISQLYIFLFKYLSILSFCHVLASMRLTELSILVIYFYTLTSIRYLFS